MKELYRKYKREIWVGVVVSLITTAILKFGDWLIEVLPVIGESIFETVANILYSLAATHTDNLLLRLLLMGSFSVLIGVAAKSTINGMKLYMKVLRVEKKSKLFTKEELEEINKEAQAELEAEEKEPKCDDFAETLKKGKRIGKSAMALVALTVLLYLFIVFFVTTPMNLYNQFQQDIVKISPYVEEVKIVQLKSDWVCMRSKTEYDEIYTVIDAVKQEYDLPQ